MRILQSIAKRFNRNRHGRKMHDNPSIADFFDKKSLAKAMDSKRRKSVGSSSGSSSVDDSFLESPFGVDSDEVTTVEWTLPLVDTESTEPQSMEEEMKRLEVLNSYFVLDSQGEKDFDRITQVGSKMFDVPICVISLVDLGRQWFLSKAGLDEAVSETPRKVAFCAHTILNKYKQLIIPDATKDFRFKDNPLVTDGLKIRFYAGAALISPEGYKLGSFCIISPEVRPQGLNAKEQEILHEMAGMVVSTMVARRNRLLKEEYETKFHQLARTFMDTTQNLESIKSDIEQLMARNTWEMDKEEYDMMHSAIETLDVQSKMCTATIRNVLQDTPIPSNASEEMKQKYEEGILDDNVIHDYDTLSNVPTTDTQKVFDNINAIVGNFLRQGEVTVEIDKSVPRKLVGCDDLLLFRAILNMLTHCMGASQEGEMCGVRLRRMKKDDDTLLVQCLLGCNPPISRQAAKGLFDNKETLLSPVASIVRSMGGQYGMYEARWNQRNSADPVQSIFWFQIPYDNHVQGVAAVAGGNNSRLSLRPFPRNLIMKHMKLNKEGIENKKNADGSTDGKPSSDPFHAALLEAGCGTASRIPMRS